MKQWWLVYKGVLAIDCAYGNVWSPCHLMWCLILPRKTLKCGKNIPYLGGVRGGGVANFSWNIFCDCICKIHILPPPCFHDWVILFDKAVHRCIGSWCDLGLMGFNKFTDLKAAHVDSIGSAVVQHASLATKSPSSCKRQEACNWWNNNLCLLDSSQCCQLHVYKKCSKGGHKAPDCPSLQSVNLPLTSVNSCAEVYIVIVYPFSPLNH